MMRIGYTPALQRQEDIQKGEPSSSPKRAGQYHVSLAVFQGTGLFPHELRCRLIHQATDGTPDRIACHLPNFSFAINRSTHRL
jgi:hypothetical protein